MGSPLTGEEHWAERTKLEALNALPVAAVWPRANLLSLAPISKRQEKRPARPSQPASMPGVSCALCHGHSGRSTGPGRPGGPKPDLLPSGTRAGSPTVRPPRASCLGTKGRTQQDAQGPGQTRMGQGRPSPPAFPTGPQAENTLSPESRREASCGREKMTG